MPSSVGQQMVKLPFSSSSTFTASEGRVSGVEVVVGVVGVVHGRLPTPSSRLLSPSSSSSTCPQTETRRLRRFPTFATSLVMNWPVKGSMKHSRTHCSGIILSASSRMSAKWELFLLLDFLLLADSSLVEEVESLLTSLSLPESTLSVSWSTRLYPVSGSHASSNDFFFICSLDTRLSITGIDIVLVVARAFRPFFKPSFSL